uniref:CSON012094 protein n=1 Tax=Culicoides sonorensis TaxID=179676 RepID=A0A336M4N4_CULSO
MTLSEIYFRKAGTVNVNESNLHCLTKYAVTAKINIPMGYEKLNEILIHERHLDPMFSISEKNNKNSLHKVKAA